METKKIETKNIDLTIINIIDEKDKFPWAKKLIIIYNNLRIYYPILNSNIINNPIGNCSLFIFPAEIPGATYNEYIFSINIENHNKDIKLTQLNKIRKNTIAYVFYMILTWMVTKNIDVFIKYSQIMYLHFIAPLEQYHCTENELERIEKCLFEFLIDLLPYIHISYNKYEYSNLKLINNRKENLNDRENSLILITVPHAECPKQFVDNLHPCDLAAEPAAKILYNFLSLMSFRVKIEFGDINRVLDVDLNRKESRGIEFRERIKKIVSETPVSWIIDMHSFFNPAFNNAEFAILDERSNS